MYHCVQAARPQLELALRHIFTYDRIRRLCVFQSRKSGEKLEDGLSSVVSKLIERCYISQNEREYYKNIRLEESKLGANKVKLARKQYRGKGRYIDEILV